MNISCFNQSNSYLLFQNTGYSNTFSKADYNKTDMQIANEVKSGNTEGISKAKIKSLKRSGIVECKTCSERKYKDDSNENVSFKAASHVSPQASGARVRAHEQEHVSNAYTKAGKNNGKVISASVSIKTAVCPECGRTYTAGGLTSTRIKYDNSNPYMKNKNSMDYMSVAGKNINYSL